jgi:hypothetical protein
LCLTPHALLLISTLIYFSPALFGSFEFIGPNGKRIDHEYSPEVKWLAAGIIAALLCVTFATRRSVLKLKIAASTDAEAIVLGLLLLASGIYVASSGHVSEVDKSVMLENTNRIHLAFYALCTVGVLFCVIAGIRRHCIVFVMSLIGLLFVLYLGHRSATAIAIVGVAYLKFRNTAVTSRVVKLTFCLAPAFLALLVYKSIYADVKAEEWDAVSARLRVENLLVIMRSGFEPFLIFSQLDFVVSEDFKLQCSNLWLVPVSVLPFSDQIISSFGGDVVRCSYHEQVKPAFFSGYSGGVGANVWAEFYSIFGVGGILILLVVVTAIYWLIEAAMRRTQSPVLLAGLTVALVNLSFYIQRKELFGAFISAKRALTITIIVLVLAWMLRVALGQFTLGKGPGLTRRRLAFRGSDLPP